MGARLIGLALQPEWAHLDPGTRIVLHTIALTARDTGTEKAPVGRYWAGNDYLAMVLTGRPLDDQNHADDAGLQAVKRALRKLREAGAIRLLEPAHRGRQAVYEVTLAQPLQDMLPVDNVVQLPMNGGHPTTPKKVTG